MAQKRAAISEVSIKTVIGEMPKLYRSGVGMMLISLPGIGKTEMITKAAKKILADTLEPKGSMEARRKAADEAFFIVDMSGIPSESLAVPFIDSGMTRENAKLQLMQILSNPSAPEMVVKEAKMMFAELKAKEDEGVIEKRLHRDVIQEIRNAQDWIAANPGKKCIVFIDEITSANQDDQRTLMNFIQSGISPDGTKLDLKNIWFILAGNPSAEMPGYEDYDGATNNIEEAVITRVATYFVKASVDDVLEWGKESDEFGNSNIHAYLTTALEADRKLYMLRDPGDIRLMNSRTLFKLSEYFRATEAMGERWSAQTIDALVGEQVGSALRHTIERLDKAVSIKELFGTAKQEKLDPKAFEKFKALQDFEKYYILSSALDESSPLEASKATMLKLVQLVREGGVPTETISSLSSRVLHAPAGTKLRKMTSTKYLMDADMSLLNEFKLQRNFAAGAAFRN